jgi:hypothetical protein
VRGQCQLLDKNHQYFQLFHCQQTQSLLITLYIIHQGEEVHDYSQSAKIRARGAPRQLVKLSIESASIRALFGDIFHRKFLSPRIFLVQMTFKFKINTHNMKNVISLKVVCN